MERYNTFWRRVFAGFIDLLVFIPVGVAIAFFSASDQVSIILLRGVVIYNAFWVYSVLMHARYGQTLGKMATPVKVLDVSERRIPTLGQAFLRDIGDIVPRCVAVIYLFVLVASQQYSRGAEREGTLGMILWYAGNAWFLLEIVTMATNEKRRALHDWIAGTVVVRDAAQTVVAGDQALVSGPQPGN